ncbi:MAG: pyridoxamine 5'-phosphate oxidase family protein [Acuticoccus sp.]
MRAEDSRFAGYSEFVSTEAALRAVLGTPPPRVTNKVQTRLDAICLDYIARSPFCIIATANADGHIDVSPKGDPVGFAKVLSDTMLALPDRPGNRRADTFRNLLTNPRIGLMFIIPGKGEVLRVRGEARIVRDTALRETMAVNGKVPALAIVVAVEEAFVHCPKCMVRSGMWKPDMWPDLTGAADIGLAMSVHSKLPGTLEEQFAQAERDGLTKLY